VTSGSDDSYFTRRQRQSRVAMNAATDRGSRLAHAQLAAAYDLLANPLVVSGLGGTLPSATIPVSADHGGTPISQDIPMPTGTVTFFNGIKGFGFIAPDGGGKAEHVHVSAVTQAGMKTLNQKQRIRYDVQSGADGKNTAVNLRSLDRRRAAPEPS
jgi:CspA family cold shock protein